MTATEQKWVDDAVLSIVGPPDTVEKAKFSHELEVAIGATVCGAVAEEREACAKVADKRADDACASSCWATTRRVET